MSHDPSPPPDRSLDPFIRAVMGRKAKDVVALDLRGLTSFTDTFIICSGGSNRQVSAIGQFIKTELKKEGLHPLSAEGFKEGHWVLLDYGHVIIHIFYEPVRAEYDLEGFWIDAKRIDHPGLKKGP